MKFIYYCFTFLYALPLSIYFFWRSLFRGESDLQRLGLTLPDVDICSPVWLVASSVGEVTIALRIISELKTRKIPTLLSVTTPAGREQAEKAVTGADIVIYHPLDLPPCVRRVARQYIPRAVLLVETELWPVLIETSAELGIKVFQVSGSISPRSFRRYRALKPYFGSALASCEALLMQTSQDAAYARVLTDGRTEISVMGSLKEEYTPPSASMLEECRTRITSWNDKQFWVCGSTREGEERILLGAFTSLRSDYPDLRLILAPRHMDRINQVESDIAVSGLQYSKWSDSSQQGEDVAVLLIDQIGLLNAIYHLSDVAFVGGTLGPIGGHNLLEPAMAGTPVIYGPYHDEQQIGHELLQQYALGQVVTEDSIVEALSTILSSDQAEFKSRSSALRSRGETVVVECLDRILNSA